MKIALGRDESRRYQVLIYMGDNQMNKTTACLMLALQLFLSASANAGVDDNHLQACLDMQGKLPPDKIIDCYNQAAQEQLANIESTKRHNYFRTVQNGGLAQEWTPSEEPISIYKQNYFLVYSHSSQPNNTPTSQNQLNNVPYSYSLDKNEMKFQISVKGHFLGQGKHTLWFGYTQLSFWQFYDLAHSGPFRESNYSPELIYSYRPESKGKYFGLTPVFLNAGVWHQSNGQSLPRSRGWNRYYIQAGLEHDFGDNRRIELLPRLWKRIGGGGIDDDNPDIVNYLGRGDIELRYCYGKGVFSAIAMKRTIQFDLALPMPTLLGVQIDNTNLHLQYFNGYGESLIDYNQRHQTLGLGISLPFD